MGARIAIRLGVSDHILTLHTVGLGIVVGLNAVIDLRLLGVARRIPLASLSGLFPLIGFGLALNTLTGLVLFMADATTKGRQPILYIKLSLIAAALWSTVLARRIVVRHAGEAVASRPAGAAWPRLAVLSLLLWAAAITAGRLMAYL